MIEALRSLERKNAQHRRSHVSEPLDPEPRNPKPRAPTPPNPTTLHSPPKPLKPQKRQKPLEPQTPPPPKKALKAQKADKGRVRHAPREPFLACTGCLLRLERGTLSPNP